MPLSPGDKLGSYEILGLLGKGGMGEVYKARDSKLNREVAIKVLPAALANDPDYLARFQREAQSLAALHHPNIATIFGLEQNAIVMELIDGQPLQGPKPLNEALPLAKQIAEALEAAHEKGIIHRDLKPANILVTPEGQIKILDFGLAKAVERTSESDRTLTLRATEAGLILGTAGYMSPEQAAGKPVDRRADIWSFGVVLHELITGKRLFDGETVSHTLAEVLKTEIDFTPVPQGPIGDLIKRCLDRNLKNRLRDIGEARIAIENYAPVRTSPPAKAGWWPWVVAALLIGVGIGGAVTRSRQPLAPQRAYRTQLNPPEGGQFEFMNDFALSPDGRTLAFSATAPGKSGLWLRPMDGIGARLLPGTTGAFSPFWSPDGRSLAYWSSGKLWRIDAAGGSPVAICDTATLLGGAWSPDGVIVFAAGPSGILRVPASGGAAEAVTKADLARGETSYVGAQLLPGGRILFTLFGKPEVAGIYAASLANPRDRVRLVTISAPAAYAAGHLLWLRGPALVAQPFDPERLTLSGEPASIAEPVGLGRAGGMLVAVSPGGLLVHGRTGGSQLTWVDRAGKPAASGANPVATDQSSSTLGDPGRYATFTVSPDGKRVAAGRSSGSGSDLWLADVARGAWSRLTFLSGLALFPVWSPDGTQVIFSGGPPLNLYRMDATGAGTEQRVTRSANTQVPTGWSRDGRLVLYTELAPETRLDLWVLPVTPAGKQEGGALAGTAARPYLRTRFNERSGQFSPESASELGPRWVAYTSDESGREEVYVRGFPEPRSKFQISTGGGSYPQWSPDGRELYYVSADNKLMASAVKLGPHSVTASPPGPLFSFTDVDRGFGSSPYTVAPDGKRFLVLKPVGGSPPLEVIVNWPALLK